MIGDARPDREPGYAHLDHYAPVAGIPDEMMAPDRRVRPVWQAFIRHVCSLEPGEIAQRFARGDEYLRDAGVYFRQYGNADSPERDWPLSHVPVLIHEAEWEALAAGLIQRADLLEAVVADLYGPQRLLTGGHLPAGLVAASPEWLRPMVGVEPRGGHFLHFVSFEVGRGPDGRWWVLGDRTQAPSGAGFALENRVATSRVFSDIYPDARVHRLAGFFRRFRSALDALAVPHGGYAAILTPGPLNDTYYEHAYIARYLGLMLLEGEDLVVDGGRVMVRTIAGLRPVSVLWRRLDASWVDPLELDDASSLGTPGMVEGIRQGTVALVNALGSGVLETRALLAFLPRLCEVLLGQPLAVPNVATWWCGDEAARQHVLANAASMNIAPALSTGLSPEGGGASSWLRSSPDAPLADRLRADGDWLVGQEAVTLSTTPAFADGRLQPRPTTLRAFLVRTQGGWQVMPGGYARIGRGGDPSALAMQRGGSVADVWVVSDQPVATATLLPAGSDPYVRPEPGVLPSRAADNLYWLGRYVERAEGIMRLLRAWHARLAEGGRADTPLLGLLRDYLLRFDIDPGQRVPEALHQTLRAAVASAGRVRDRFSVDGWMALNDLAKTARRMSATVTEGEDEAHAMSVLLRKITGFAGLVHENMYRSSGWRFLTIGRSLERAASMASILARFAEPHGPDGSFDLAVEVGDSVMTHRSRYAVATTRETVVDLLAIDGMNPRSVLYNLAAIREQVGLLPGERGGERSALARAILQLHTGLAVQTPEDLSTRDLDACCADIARLSELLSEAYLR